MGIKTDEFFENIYSVIFSPKEFFENKDIKISLRVALFNILFITIFANSVVSVLQGKFFRLDFIFEIILLSISAVIFWLISGLYLEYIAKIYSKNVGFTKILFYLSFIPVPYIFLAPLSLFLLSGNVFHIIALFLQCVLFFWIIFLCVYCLKVVYETTLSRAFMLIFLPFISTLFFIYLSVCLSSNFRYIFSI